MKYVETNRGLMLSSGSARGFTCTANLLRITVSALVTFAAADLNAAPETPAPAGVSTSIAANFSRIAVERDRLHAQFEADYAKYLTVRQDSAIRQQEKLEAWHAICRKFNVTNATDYPSGLNWDRRTSSAFQRARLPYLTRTVGMRSSLLGRHGGGARTEDTVVKALRWLKKSQLQDGSWPQTKPAMTALALLVFLGHGDGPTSEEFGKTVENGLAFLLKAQQPDGRFAGRDANDYTLPIASIALSETYGLTTSLQTRQAAAKTVRLILDGQSRSGTFGYNLEQTERIDTSYLTWCVQALWSAAASDVWDGAPEDLGMRMRQALGALKRNYTPVEDKSGGGFGYTAAAVTGLTGAGARCLQLLGAEDSDEARRSLATMRNWSFKWNNADFGGTLYYAYFSTQAKFGAGGDDWIVWNRQLVPALCENQSVVANAATDYSGRPRDIGYWDSEAVGQSDQGDGKRVMTTCLCALMLETYYRYPMTFDLPKE